MKIKPPLKWHGGKFYLASRIVALFPPHLHYVEPYAGGLSVLLARDPEGVSEVVNDINGELANFWSVLQHDDTFAEFRRYCEATPFSEKEFDAAQLGRQEYRCGEVCPVGESNPDAAFDAWNFFVACRQSLAGRMKSFTGITRTRTRRGMNNEVSAWLTAIEGLPAVHERLKRVLILSRDALDVIRSQDGDRTLFYLDPPYVHDTRATTSDYAHEMTIEQHRALLSSLTSLRGKFMLSGYANPLYDEFATAHSWARHDFDLPNNAAGGDTKRRMVESLWCNF